MYVALMDSTVGWMSEAFSADSAFKRLASCMRPYMSPHFALAPEGLGTTTAFQLIDIIHWSLQYLDVFFDIRGCVLITVIRFLRKKVAEHFKFLS